MRLGIDAPSHVKIHRQEVYETIQSLSQQKKPASMPRTATIPITLRSENAFFVAVWGPSLCRLLLIARVFDSDPFFAKFGRGWTDCSSPWTDLLWMVAGAFRFNELAKLRTSDIDWQGCSIHIKRSKNGDIIPCDRRERY